MSTLTSLTSTGDNPSMDKENTDDHAQTDLSDRAEVQLLLSGVPDVHMKAYLFGQKGSPRTVGAKSDYEAIKWREQAERELLRAQQQQLLTPATSQDGVGHLGSSATEKTNRERTLYRALVCFNLAVANAETSEPAITSADNVDSELSMAYFGRGQVYLQLGQWEQALCDIDRAIAVSRSKQNSMRMHFALLDYYLVTQKENLALNCNKAIELVKSIGEKFASELNSEQSEELAKFASMLEHQQELKSLNTINYSRKTLVQSLKCTKMSSMATKDKILVGKLVNDSSESLLVVDDAVKYVDGKLKMADSSIGQSRLLLLEQAFAHVAKPGTELSHCASCLVSLQFFPVVPCRSCSSQLYCSEQCESQFWSWCHQFECGSVDNRSVWDHLDLTAKLTARVLLRFGTFWHHVADFTREFICANDDRFGPQQSDQLGTKPIELYRSLCEWFLGQESASEHLKMPMDKFSSLLGQCYGVFSVVDQCSNTYDEVRLSADYRAKMLHGIILCRLVLECALRTQIAEPIQGGGLIGQQQLLRQCTVRARVHQLMLMDKEQLTGGKQDDADGDNNFRADSAKLFRCLLQQVKQQEQDGQESQLPDGTIGIALYPGNVCLRLNADDESRIPLAPNGAVVYNGTYRAIRSTQPISKGQMIQIGVPTGAYFVEDHKQLILSEKVVEQMVKQYLESMIKLSTFEAAPLNKPKQVNPELDAQVTLLEGLHQEMDKQTEEVPLALKLGLFTDLGVLNERKGNFKLAVDYAVKCLDLTKQPSMVNTRLAFLLRLCKLQFELFTERDLAPRDSMALANNCLVNCSQVIFHIERHSLPLRVLMAVTSKEISPNGQLMSEELVVHEHIATLVELEEMMVSANMFAQQIEQGLRASSTPIAAS